MDLSSFQFANIKDRSAFLMTRSSKNADFDLLVSETFTSIVLKKTVLNVKFCSCFWIVSHFHISLFNIYHQNISGNMLYLFNLVTPLFHSIFFC